MKKITQTEITHKIELTEQQIAIIKAGLVYWLMLDEFGGSRWYQITGMADTNGSKSKNLVNSTHNRLESVSSVEPDYGVWFHPIGLNNILANKLEEIKDNES